MALYILNSLWELPIHQTPTHRVHLIPRASKPAKTWKYGQFTVQAYTCNNCKTQYKEYTQNGKHKFTLKLPKGILLTLRVSSEFWRGLLTSGAFWV